MKEKKIKVIAMVLSLFAACGGMSSAMETSKSEENSKMNLKSDQNNNRTENNKPQSDSKSNQNVGVQIPYYDYLIGYLGLNEIGGLLGFNYLLFGKYGIIKGAKYLLSDEKSEIKTKGEIEKGPYWQHNHNMLLQAVDESNVHEHGKNLLKKVFARLIANSSEKFLSTMLGITYSKFSNEVNDFLPILHFGSAPTFYEKCFVAQDKQQLSLTKQIKEKYGVSEENSWLKVLFDNLRGNKKVSKSSSYASCLDLTFEQDNVKFSIRLDFPYYTFHNDIKKNPKDYKILVIKIDKESEITVTFQMPTWLYSCIPAEFNSFIYFI